MSAKKCFKFTKRFFERQSKLSAIINKSRLFNTYESIYEIGLIFFYNSVAQRLNQNLLISTNTIGAFVSVLGQLFIHVSPRQMYYRISITVNIISEGSLGYQMYMIWQCFKAVINDCDNIWAYYQRANGDQTTAISNAVCINAKLLHALWMMANVGLMLLRFISLYFMVKGLDYLNRREEERIRRMNRQLLKAKRYRERKRNELERKIAKKKQEAREANLKERRQIDEEDAAAEEKKMIDEEKLKQQLLLFS